MLPGAVPVDRLASLEAENAMLREQLAAAHQVQAAGEAQRLATLELSHRTKNILSVLQSLINHTLTNGADIAKVRDRLGQRTAAMGRAIDLLLRTDWQATELDQVVANALVHKAEFASRIIADVPALQVNADTTLVLTMAIHELESNAVKYGALSSGGGQVTIEGRLQARSDGGQALALSWVERGGPAVTPPDREGFGTRLITTVPSRKLGGTAELTFAPEGAAWHFRAPFESVAG